MVQFTYKNLSLLLTSAPGTFAGRRIPEGSRNRLHRARTANFDKARSLALLVELRGCKGGGGDSSSHEDFSIVEQGGRVLQTTGEQAAR